MKSPLKQILFILLVAGQLGTLGWLVYSRSELINSGEKIRLECEPVDPRSLLSGDYVVLNYKISDFSGPELSALLEEDRDLKVNAPVWVELGKSDDGDFYEAKRISALRENLQGGVIIKGTVKNYRPGSGLRIRYGLEQYFVPQYEGKEIEKQLNNTSVEVAVNEKGDSAVIRIFIDGEAVDFH